MVDGGGIGAGASGRNGGFLFRQPLGWVNDLLAETLEIYEEVSDGPVPFDLAPWPMLVLAVEEDELAAAQAYAEAVGGEEVDLRGDPWFADDLAGAFVVDGGRTLDAMGATTALAEAARREGVVFRLGCEAKRILVRGRARHRPRHGRRRAPLRARRPRHGPLAAPSAPLGGSRLAGHLVARLAPGDWARRPAAAVRDRAGALADAGRDGRRSSARRPCERSPTAPQRIRGSCRSSWERVRAAAA